MSEQKNRIKIVKTPNGPWSREVRKAWVGLILPCEPLIVRQAGHWQFQVSQTDAIAAVTAKHPEIGRYWRDHEFPHEDGVFLFRESDVEPIGEFERQALVEVTEEIQGCLLR